MYQIGQITKNQINSYLNNLTFIKDLVDTEDTTIVFKDPRISLTGSNVLSLSNSYYLSFKVKQVESYTQDFIIKLKSNESGSTSFQSIKNINVKKGNLYPTFELIFTPNSTYNQIIFELQRTSVDFSSGSGRVLDIEIIKLAKVNNIISDVLSTKYSGLSELKKIGIQSKPGLLFTINGEEIRVGRSGIYELYHKDIPIYYLGFIVDDNDFFILDFKY